MSDTNISSLDPAIRRAKIGSLVIYEITESELQQLEQGNPESNYLTFSVSLLSIAVSFFTSLLTTKIENYRTFTVFVALTIITFITGIFLMFVWLCKRRKTKNIIMTIKGRLPPEGIPEKQIDKKQK